MVTDADLDECTDLAKGRTDALGNDAIRDGVPAIGGAVVISGSDVALGEGVVYADGVRGVLAAAGATSGGPLDIFGQQADLPLGPALPAAPRIVYADIWERPVFALEDPYLADPGLHGAETTYRSRTMTQIKAAPLAAAAAIEQGSGDFPQVGDAVLAVAPRDPESTIDECDPCAEVVAAEQTIANALFRLEVVQVEGTPSAPTRVHLAWSAENGAAIAPASVSPEEFERAGAAYEFFSEITESYMGAFADPADLRHSTFVDDLEATPNPPQDHDGDDWPFVRRWDGHAIVDLTTGTVAATLGSGFTLGFDGTTVTLGLDTFDAKLTLAGHRVLRGDYWLVELRTFADPASRVRLVQATPVGILHHYCLLVRTRRGVIEPLTDAERRKLSLPPLSDLPASHVGFVNNCPKLYAGAENVQDALDELCAISAEDVGFDPTNCPSLYDEAKTVQEALDRLCARQTGGCCRDRGRAPGQRTAGAERSSGGPQPKQRAAVRLSAAGRPPARGPGRQPEACHRHRGLQRGHHPHPGRGQLEGRRGFPTPRRDERSAGAARHRAEDIGPGSLRAGRRVPGQRDQGNAPAVGIGRRADPHRRHDRSRPWDRRRWPICSGSSQRARTATFRIRTFSSSLSMIDSRPPSTISRIKSPG